MLRHRLFLRLLIAAPKMPFPHHDRYWNDAANFLREHHQAGETIIAPDEFVDLFPEVVPYVATFLPPGAAEAWIVVHKGLLENMAHPFLEALAVDGRPVFANDVFVIFVPRPGLPTMAAATHVTAFREKLLQLDPQRLPPAHLAHPMARRDVARLSLAEIREAMNARFRSSEHDEFGGYEHRHLWDKIRYREIDRLFARLIQPIAGRRILDVACGIGRSVPMMGDGQAYLGIDLSEVAIAKVEKLYGARANLKFRCMDAMQLELDDSQFDVVMAVEMIEHVQDATKTISEMFRVLKPGGRLVINSINRDSLHLRMLRKRGYPEFRGTTEHIREFTFRELSDLIEQAGFVVENSAGVFLQPYYGIPEVDHAVRHLTDDDSDVVEWLRELGERAGAEYAYEFVLSARKGA